MQYRRLELVDRVDRELAFAASRRGETPIASFARQQARFARQASATEHPSSAADIARHGRFVDEIPATTAVMMFVMTSDARLMMMVVVMPLTMMLLLVASL